MIALGVEDIDTLRILKNLGVRFVQGYYFARPDLKVDAINEKLKDKLEELNQETIS